ncbi:MAG: hypothetical protein WC870_01665 [Candidatus Paceibacterota bacterium]
MYFLLILFFGSLLGIIFMIGRKLLMLQGGQVLAREEISFKTPHLEEWRHQAIKEIKKHGYAGLVATIRLYMRSSNVFKNKYQEIKVKVKDLHSKKLNIEEKREVSKFLKKISEYKNKIRKIKQKVKEEENL